MSIVIQLVNGSPKKRKGDKMAGVILTRDPKLGFRMKVQAVPSGRELHRLVSDCPLAITEQTLLWLQRHKWQWKLHPNSLDVRELLRQVKTYTDLLPAEHIGNACDLLLENFRSKSGEGEQADQAEQAEQPQITRDQMMHQMMMMQQEMAKMKSGQSQSQGGMEGKMQRTRQRTAQVLEQVEQTVAANERREKMQQEVLENLDSIVDEVDSIVDSGPESNEIEIPEMFSSPQAAIDWALDLGVFDDEDEAKSEYQSLKTQEKPSNAQEMASIWTSTCIEIYDIINDDEE